jgi:hypothetical protein
MKEDDPLHAKVHDSFTLNGVYLTPPRLSTGTPSIVVKCMGGKVEQSYLNVHAVVVRHEGYQPEGLEVRMDGKSDGHFLVDAISTDGEGLYFTRLDLKEMLYAKKVIVGVNEYLGPQVVMQFDIPDPSPVMEKCGEDKILKRPDRINKKAK